jgi:hypothetical protein
MLNDDQSREYNRFQKMFNFFGENTTVFSTFPPFASEVADFNTNFGDLQSYVPQKDASGKGITIGKKDLKTDISNETSDLCSTVAAYAVTYGNTDLASQMNHNKSYIYKQKDADILGFVTKVTNAITPLLTDPNFTPYGITADTLAAIVADATTFNGNIGQASLVDEGSAAANVEINKIIGLLEANNKQFDRLINNFSKKNSTFVTTYHLASAVDNSGIHHSGFEGNITDATTGNPLANVLINLLNTLKTTTTDLLGNYELIRIPPGNYQVTFSASGKTSKTIILHVTRGRIATMNISL